MQLAIAGFRPGDADWVLTVGEVHAFVHGSRSAPNKENRCDAWTQLWCYTWLPGWWLVSLLCRCCLCWEVYHLLYSAWGGSSCIFYRGLHRRGQETGESLRKRQLRKLDTALKKLYFIQCWNWHLCNATSSEFVHNVFCRLRSKLWAKIIWKPGELDNPSRPDGLIGIVHRWPFLEAWWTGKPDSVWLGGESFLFLRVGYSWLVRSVCSGAAANGGDFFLALLEVVVV